MASVEGDKVASLHRIDVASVYCLTPAERASIYVSFRDATPRLKQEEWLRHQEDDAKLP